MKKELKNKTENLKKILYNNEFNDQDRLIIQKNLFELLRECIKSQVYEVEVGSYILNINPNTLSVKYETPETIIELSNEDIYFETERELEVKFYTLKDVSLNDRSYPIIKVSGLINNVDGDIIESYQIELFTKNEDNIKNYLSDNLGEFTFTSLDIETPYSVILSRTIKNNSLRINPINFFKKDSVIPIIYDYTNKRYINASNDDKISRDYIPYLPVLQDKKEIVNYLYGLIIDFYNDYLNKQ